ncbi:MAG: GNAT family N-acetyltransferase [Lachnospiraceae bacterium]|nr:GNAT family N-acetyltransferase [Lachnospiraceae bacterium]
MGLEFLQASTVDALTITGISRRSFHSDVEVGSKEKTGPPGYMSVPFYMKMARSNHLYKLVADGLIVGGAVLFPDNEKLNIGRIFISPENHRKGYGVFVMQEIEALYPSVKEITLDTPIWNIRTNAFYKKLGYT